MWTAIIKMIGELIGFILPQITEAQKNNKLKNESFDQFIKDANNNRPSEVSKSTKEQIAELSKKPEPIVEKKIDG